MKILLQYLIRILFNSKSEKEDKVKASISTGLITMLLLLFLIFVAFKAAEVEESSDSGVMVQLGEPNQGGPDNTPATERVVAVKPQSSEPTENTMTTNQDDAVNIDNTKPKPKPNNTQQTDPTPEPPKIETALEKAMREAREGRESRGQGDGTEKGTQGQPDGTGTSPTGGNTGTGTSGAGEGFQLGKGFGSRGIGYAPSIRSSCIDAKGGKIIFKVEVAPSGTVIQVFNPNTGERGSNVTSSCLMREALDLVKQVKLTPIPGGVSTIGEIVINIRN